MEYHWLIATPITSSCVYTRFVCNDKSRYNKQSKNFKLYFLLTNLRLNNGAQSATIKNYHSNLFRVKKKRHFALTDKLRGVELRNSIEATYLSFNCCQSIAFGVSWTNKAQRFVFWSTYHKAYLRLSWNKGIISDFICLSIFSAHIRFVNHKDHFIAGQDSAC